MRGGFVVAFVVAWMVALASRSAAAQGPPSIDTSTIRVFAVGTVDVKDVQLSETHVVKAAKAHAGHGTGFVLEAGLVMTAAHVVEGARHVVVRLPGDGGFFPARVAYADSTKDIAVLAVDGALPPTLVSGAEPPRVRSSVFAVGYPLDATRRQPQSARGIIAGYLDDGTVQLDMALNPGNSGGPVVNEQDEVVGMAVARGAVEHGVQGIGYAVPVAMLRAAMVEAKRRLATGEASSPAGMSRDSAMVVDELVQHGAFHELRKKTDLAEAPAGDLDQALADVLARIQDADLLVFVASALWNASLALEYIEPGQFELTPDQAYKLRTRLRESSTAAVRRALEIDGTVGSRSAFVALATAQPTDRLAPTAASASADAQPQFHVQAAPVVRFNEATGSTGWGGGVSGVVAFGRRDQQVRPIVGMAFAAANVTTDAGEFSHMLASAQLGVLAHFDDVELFGALEGCMYFSSVASATTGSMYGSASASAIGARFGIGYRFGRVVLGTAARVLGGPTLWLEPVTLAVHL